MNIPLLINRCVNRFTERIALVHEDTRLTFRELEEQTNSIANNLLSLGLTKRDRVALLSPNRIELVLGEYGIYKAGLVSVPLNARLSMDETIHMLNNSEASAFLIGKEYIDEFDKVRDKAETVKHFMAISNPLDYMMSFKELLQGPFTPPDVNIDMDDLCSLRYTSGTTGKLKATMMSHRNRISSTKKRLLIPDVELDQNSVACHVGPITHASGAMVLPTWWMGGCNLILNGFDEKILLVTIEEERVTHMFAAPTMLNMLMAYPDVRKYDLSSLRTIWYGSSPMPVTRIREALEIFGPVFIQGYGQTETASAITFLSKEDHLVGDDPVKIKRLSSCGVPNLECDVRVVNAEGEDVKPGEIGEIIERGDDSMVGYWNDPELTRETIKDGWIYTRDMATVDEAGYIYIVDRKSDMIISGGFNVYPSEVENAIYTHPAVFEAGVIAVPDEIWGESVKACVVLKPGESATEEEIIIHCKECIASYKKPKSVDFMDELPKNPYGKVLRRKLKEKYWVDQERGVH
ncbi:AMP-binding protein [Thermodesulfobacteriota bacterium]